MFRCKYCKRKPFKTQNGLRQHLSLVTACFHLSQGESNGLRASLRGALGNLDEKTLNAGSRAIGGTAHNGQGIENYAQENLDYGQNPIMKVQEDPDDGSTGLYCFNDEDDNSSTASTCVAIEGDANADTLEKFLEYVANDRKKNRHLTKEEVNCIKLIDTLRRKRATLDTYEAVLEWHLRASGKLEPQMTLGDYTNYISRKKMIKKLIARYPVPPELFKTKICYLPVSKARVVAMAPQSRDFTESKSVRPDGVAV